MNNSDSKASCGFFIIPKSLINDPEYSDLSIRASFLYGLMLDRLALSEKNCWKDEDGQPYIYFTVSKAAKALKCSEPIALKTIKELEQKNLISKKQDACGKPSKIFIKHAEEFKKFKQSDSKKLNPTAKEYETEAFKNFKSNNTENNNTDFINTLLYSSAEEEVKDKIDYDYLISVEHKDEIDNIVSIIVETLETKNCAVRIGSELKQIDDVRKKLLSLNDEHIIYVLELIDSCKEPIHDIRGYFLKLLYYAPMTMSLYYSARVAADMNNR